MIYILILVMLIISAIQSLLILYPLFKRKFGRKVRRLPNNDITFIRQAVLNRAYSIINTNKAVMSFNDDESIYAALSRLKNRILKNSAHKNYAYFNFPLAFTLIGLIDTYKSSPEKQNLIAIEKKCSELIDNAGNIKFNLDKIDQATFGVVFLKMFELTQKSYYLKGAHKIYDSIQVFKREDGLYKYRKDLDIFFIDTVGLLCPFLVLYAEVTQQPHIQLEAEDQVIFALSHCTESNLGIPIHALDLLSYQPLGSVNWSRGMGWMLLGLSAVAYQSDNNLFKASLDKYCDILMNIRQSHGFWAQFLGHTNDTEIDSSATLMFLYALRDCKGLTINEELIRSFAALCVDFHGYVNNSSGDTIYINKYSRVKGPSELTQGLMLSLISEI